MHARRWPATSFAALSAHRYLLPAGRRCASVQLFVDRAAAHRSSLLITERDATVLTEVCTRLDGIPLAIELAAARVRSLSLDTIAQSLDDRFSLLSIGERSALPRQQTLRALVAWSHDLLN